MGLGTPYPSTYIFITRNCAIVGGQQAQTPALGGQILFTKSASPARSSYSTHKQNSGCSPLILGKGRTACTSYEGSAARGTNALSAMIPPKLLACALHNGPAQTACTSYKGAALRDPFALSFTTRYVTSTSVPVRCAPGLPLAGVEHSALVQAKLPPPAQPQAAAPPVVSSPPVPAPPPPAVALRPVQRPIPVPAVVQPSAPSRIAEPTRVEAGGPAVPAAPAFGVPPRLAGRLGPARTAAQQPQATLSVQVWMQPNMHVSWLSAASHHSSPACLQTVTVRRVSPPKPPPTQAMLPQRKRDQRDEVVRLPPAKRPSTAQPPARSKQVAAVEAVALPPAKRPSTAQPPARPKQAAPVAAPEPIKFSAPKSRAELRAVRDCTAVLLA